MKALSCSEILLFIGSSSSAGVAPGIGVYPFLRI